VSALSDEIEAIVNDVLYAPWDLRKGTAVPTTDSVALRGGGVELDASILYADLAQSSKLASELDRRVAAKVVKAFLGCATKLIKAQGGEITSFDGDRVMGVFVGDTKNTDAAICALQINYAIEKVLKPKLSGYFQSLSNEGFSISHASGVDTGTVLAVRAGLRGANDLVWIGRAPNFAAKLSDLREAPYASFISADVFDVMNKSAKDGGSPEQLMWEQRSLDWLGTKITVYRSSWTWKP
jgi:class 3 adenylate cyclase